MGSQLLLPVIALITVPYFIEGLGTERYGVLSLVTVVVGYFVFFDLGIGAALTKLVAERLAIEREGEVPELVWTSLAIMACLSLLGVLLLAVLSPFLIRDVLKIPTAVQGEAILSFYLLAASLPVMVTTAALGGVLVGYQRFDVLSVLRIATGSASLAAPLLVLPFSQNLAVVVAVMLVTRVAAWVAHFFACVRVVPDLTAKIRVDVNSIRPLAKMGGWMTVSNLVSPLMVTLDQFLIGAFISSAAVAYYATPYNAVTRLWLFPAAVGAVLFPAFAATVAARSDRTSRLYDSANRYTLLVMFPLTLLLLSFAEEGLEWWLGHEFASASSTVVRLLALGVFINSFAQTAFALLQSAGRPDITAKLHLIELPAYALIVVVLLQHYGIIGVAAAWSLRVAVDALLLLVAAPKVVPNVRKAVERALLSVAAGLLFLVPPLFFTSTVTRTIYAVAALALFIFIGLFVLLSQADRAFLLRSLSFRWKAQ